MSWGSCPTRWESPLRSIRPVRIGTRKIWRWGVVLALLLSGASLLAAREEPLRAQFKYAGGTESLAGGCAGNLQLNPEALTFKCAKGTISVPYSSISLMQYRSDISNRVHRLKVRWKVHPGEGLPFVSPKQNRFFTVVYRLEGRPHVIVLKVRPEAMRPYLAELELRAEKRVEVQSYEEY